MLVVSYSEVACVDELVVENREESGMTSARLRLARHAASSVLEHKTIRQYFKIVPFPELFSNDYIEF